MIMEMKKNRIEPFLTMYHWELPQALQDEGGWVNESIIDAFEKYAIVIAENFTDLCDKIFTLNEPQCFLGLANSGTNGHAPGKKLPYKDVFQLIHNALKAHGKAVIALRKYAKGEIKVGYAPTSSLFLPASNKPEDIEAARRSYMRDIICHFTLPKMVCPVMISWMQTDMYMMQAVSRSLITLNGRRDLANVMVLFMWIMRLENVRQRILHTGTKRFVRQTERTYQLIVNRVFMKKSVPG